MRIRSPHLIRLILGSILLFQAITHLTWLSISAHSGQVAIPYMLNQGLSLFDTVWEQHAPGTSLIMTLAQRVLPLEPITLARLLNLVVVGTITLLVYRIASTLVNNSPMAGIAAALFWAWWEPVYGTVLFYFDTLLGLCVCVALLIWVEQGKRRPFAAAFGAGLWMGLATLMKQHAWPALILFGLYLFGESPSEGGRGESGTQKSGYLRRAGYWVGALLPPLILIGVVGLQGNLERYLYWNWGFNFSGLMEGAPLTGDFVRKLTLSNLFAAPLGLLMFRRAAPKRFWILLFLLWASTTLTLIPRFNHFHAMAHLPFAAIIAGVVVGTLVGETNKPASHWISNLPHTLTRDLVLIGLLLAVGAAIFGTGIVVYIPNVMGRAAIPAYDEFDLLARRLSALSAPGDRLFVLPETDSTPNLHVITGLLPPRTWIKGWRWYLEAPGVIDHLLTEWAQSPPDWVIVFPDLLAESQPEIGSLYQWVIAHCEMVETIKGVVFHGDAVIYRLPKP